MKNTRDAGAREHQGKIPASEGPMRGESLCSTAVRITVSGDAVRRTPGYRKTAEHDHGCADAEPLDAKTTERYCARRRQHHDPDKRSSRDPRVEPGRDSEINDQ